MAREYLEPLRDEGIDTLIMGCTHYPLLAPIIAKVMGPGVTLIDPGKETALAVQDALQALELTSSRTEGGKAEFYVSDTAESFQAAAQLFLGQYAGGPVEQVPIEKY